MTDLLQGRSVSEIEKYLEKIWTMSFRTLDDIKESVRAAAFKTCRVLTLMTVKYCDPKHVSSTEGQRVLSIMIPFLVQKGLLSSAEEVSKFSLSTILKICKQAGPLLRSHIPTIVIALLDGLTTMEPQLMSEFYKWIVLIFSELMMLFHTSDQRRPQLFSFVPLQITSVSTLISIKYRRSSWKAPVLMLSNYLRW